MFIIELPIEFSYKGLIMTESKLLSLVTKYGATSVVELINNYVHTMFFDPSHFIDISCDYDYNNKAVVNPIFICTDYSGGFITLSPAEDTSDCRWYVDRVIDIVSIRAFSLYAKTQNAYMQGVLDQVKADKAAGKKTYNTRRINYQALANKKNYPPRA